MRALVSDVSVPRQVVSALLGRLDKRFYFGPFSPTALREVPDPVPPAPGWLVLRTRLCGICGSDYKQLFLNGSMDNPMTAVISFPQVLGHEVVGTVERLGPGVRTRRVGERVVLNPWLSCAPRGIEPPCPECAEGRYSLCRNFARGAIPPGIHTGNSRAATGGFAPLLPAHESMCIPIPPGVTDEQAVLADPFSVSLHGILKRPPADGATALVYGCGTLGLLAVAILRTLYPRTRVLAVARFPHQRRLAERFGATAVLPHAPAKALIEAVAAASGGTLMTPWYGLPWIHGGGVGDPRGGRARRGEPRRDRRHGGRAAATVRVDAALLQGGERHRVERVRRGRVRGAAAARDGDLPRPGGRGAHRRDADHHPSLRARAVGGGVPRLRRPGRVGGGEGPLRL